MSARDFALRPCGPAPAAAAFTLTGTLTRSAAGLTLRYDLRGPLAELVIPAPAAAPARRFGLWEATCLECFLGVPGSPAYWELNLSPAGHWHLFRFASYRHGMEDEEAVAALPLRRQQTSARLILEVALPLATLVSPDRPLEAAPTAVLQHRDGSLTYWALTHPGPQPDFHRRDGFLLHL